MILPRSVLVLVGPGRWRSKALFLIGGAVVGLAAVLLAKLADAAQLASMTLRASHPWWSLALPPLGFALLAEATARFLPGGAGSGIPQVMAARALHDDAQRAALVSPKVAAGKMILLTLGLLLGASIGREGPTVQIGAAIMFAAARLSPTRRRGFVLAGAATGVAAAFNTPLAGIVFAIEELSRSFEVRTNGLVIGTIIVAGLTSLALVGEYAYFGQTPAVLATWRDWLAIPLIGIVGGVSGGLFCKVVAVAGRAAPGRWWTPILARPVLLAFGCGLIVSACAWLSGGDTFGTGYEQARGILHGEQLPTLWYAPLKFVATLASSLSGIPGGIFAPSLSIGAGLGAAMAALLPHAPAAALAVLGMAAFLTGVVQAPITAFVIVSEMTQNHALVIPLMLTAVIARATASLLCRRGLYHDLARSLLRSRLHGPAPRKPA